MTVAAILPQVDQLFVFLDGFDEVPALLHDRENITVLRSQDAGDVHAAGRFLMLRSLKRPSVVLVIDDDIHYPEDYVQRLVDALAAVGGKAVVGVHGTVFKPPYRSYITDLERFHFTDLLAKSRVVDELGSGTCAFLSDVLDFDIQAWPRFDANDLLLAIEAKKRGLPLICVARGRQWLRPQGEEQADSIWVSTKRNPAPKSALMRSLICEVTAERGENPGLSWIVPGSVLSDSIPDVPRGLGRDVYLQPHCDDVCFSLGGRTTRLKGGQLVTVFPINGYVASSPGRSPPSPDAVTAIRKEEDRAFARACGLELHFMNIPSASYRGYRSFDLGCLDENQRLIEGPLTAELLSRADVAGPATRPWLYCPAGIGGHVDHVAIFETVLAHYDELSDRYRIAFYEDLHYASHPGKRANGIARMLRRAKGRKLRRRVFLLDLAHATRKLDTIRLYASQFEVVPENLRSFVPATRPRQGDHEAIWSEEPHPEAITFQPAVEFAEAAFRLFDRLTNWRGALNRIH